jgi:hypothetical protein
MLPASTTLTKYLSWRRFMSGSFGGRLAHSLERFAAKWEPAHRDEPRCGEPLIIQGLPPARTRR